MKILYGVQGTGNGHITRARVMAAALKQRNVDVDFVFSGRPANKYFDMEVFGDYRTFDGLTFITDHGRVRYLKTAKSLKLLQMFQDIKTLDVSQYDLVLNDFEPITAWAAKRHNQNHSAIPVINISHQASFRYSKVPTQGMNWFNRQLLKYFAPADLNLGVHWYHFGQTILPPFIEPIQVVPSTERPDVFSLVYLPFEDLQEIKDVLNGCHHHKFVVYHPDVEMADEDAAVVLKKPCRDGFLKDLVHSQGVIANAGFELSSEALTMGKKLLLKPLQGQFEQTSNAMTLVKLGLASVMQRLDDDIIENWLRQPGIDRINYPSDPSPVIDWLLAGDYQNPQALCNKVWQSVSTRAFASAG